MLACHLHAKGHSKDDTDQQWLEVTMDPENHKNVLLFHSFAGYEVKHAGQGQHHVVSDALKRVGDLASY